MGRADWAWRLQRAFSRWRGLLAFIILGCIILLRPGVWVKNAGAVGGGAARSSGPAVGGSYAASVIDAQYRDAEKRAGYWVGVAA